MKQFSNAATKALDALPLFMTQDLRNKALENGWSPDVANSISVVREAGVFSVKVGAEHAAQAFTHEYGNESMRPTAVIRRFDSDTTSAESFFLKAFGTFLGGKK
jgi:hypothetical protein